MSQNHSLKDRKEALQEQKEVLKQERATLETQNTALKNKWAEIKQDRQNKDFAKLSSDLNSIPAFEEIYDYSLLL